MFFKEVLSVTTKPDITILRRIIMKVRTLSATALVFAMVLSGTTASPAFAFGDKKASFSPDKKAAKLQKKLVLSDEQTAQVRSILESAKQEAIELKNRTNSRLEAVLTPEQRTKYQQLKHDWEEKWQKHKGRKDKRS